MYQNRPEISRAFIDRELTSESKKARITMPRATRLLINVTVIPPERLGPVFH